MSNPSPSSNGKGSARRRENLAKVRENWDSIDWSKGRPAAKQREIHFLIKDEKTIERLKAIPLRGGATPLADSRFWTENGAFLSGDPLASDAENDLNEQMQEDDLRPY